MARSWTTDRLVLRQAPPAHAPAVRDYGMRSREFHRPWDPARPPDFWDEHAVAERLAMELDNAAHDRSLALYIALRDEPGRYVGRVALNTIMRGAFQSCVAGYGLAPEATGKGYMTEALSEAVRIAFAELRLHRVEVNVIPRNLRSVAVAQRCGFVREGLSPRYLRIAGRWEDHIRFARLNPLLEAVE